MVKTLLWPWQHLLLSIAQRNASTAVWSTYTKSSGCRKNTHKEYHRHFSCYLDGNLAMKQKENPVRTLFYRLCALQSIVLPCTRARLLSQRMLPTSPCLVRTPNGQRLSRQIERCEKKRPGRQSTQNTRLHDPPNYYSQQLSNFPFGTRVSPRLQEKRRANSPLQNKSPVEETCR